MKNSTKWNMRVLYGLIFLSGSAALIYQVVWHKYLGILLGAQARATAIILAIFLGGISAGYAVFGRWSRWKNWNLMKVYALVEVGLGIWAFMFPFVFKLMMPTVAWMFGAFGINNLFIDFFIATLLIGFPTFLMGGTLPLLTQGLSADLREASQTHARIYGFNTLGSCLGCVLAGYILIPNTALSITSMFGGLLNFTVAGVSYLLFARRSSAQVVTEPVENRGFKWNFSKPQVAILVVGFLSGFYLITLETVLIRLMGLSTGASNYNFTLIVAIFIFGLGIGSLLMKNISGYGPARLFWNQVLVSFFLFVLYLSGDYWSYAVHVVRSLFRDMPQTFYVFQGTLGIGFLALLALPIGFSGITLPLCFHLIKDTKESLGHRVGQLYGLNTVGCVMGALIGGYALLNVSFIDLDTLFKICIFMSLITVGAAAYLYFPQGNPSRGTLSFSSGLVALVFFGLFFAPSWNRERFIQPFRHPAPTPATFSGASEFGKFLARSTEFLFWKDGPNTSIGIGASKYQGKEVSRTIFVNGKSDGNTRGDFFTTVMLAHIPAMFAKKMDRVCVIGFGTGITIGTLMQYPQVKTIDVAEISNFSIANAHYFDPYNNGVSRNNKVTFNEMDAFRFLQGTPANFDLVVSEPSNPWVAGIENLYSAEFYEIARNKLGEDGVFVQWIHTYSFTDDLLKMVLKTIGTKFEYVSVWQLKGGDLALVAKRKAPTREEMQIGANRIAESPIIRQMLNEAGITRIEGVLALEIVPSTLAPVLAEGSQIHDLESPKLSNEAAKAFFVGSSSRIQQIRRQYKEFFPSIAQSLLNIYTQGQPLTPETVDSLVAAYCENPAGRSNFLCEESLAVKKLYNPGFEIPWARYQDIVQTRDVASFDTFSRPTPKKFTAADLQNIYNMFELYKRYASPVARISPRVFLDQTDHCMKTTPYADELFGECLLQKILVLETTTPPGPEFTAAVNQYLDWFPQLSKTAPNYPKLEEAKNILVRLASRAK